MTPCERLSDRMPDVARGRATWTRDDANHLSGCAACQEEWGLIRMAATHGMAIGMQVDVVGITEQVVERLQAVPISAAAPSRTFRKLAWPLALAASLSLMVWGGLPRSATPSGEPIGVVSVLHELDGLTSEELQAMLELVPEPAATSYRTLETPESLSDLSTDELQLLLSSMEG